MTKIEELKAAYEAAPAVSRCDGDHIDSRLFKFVCLTEELMPQLLEAVDLMQEACEYASPLPPELVTKIERILEKMK